MGNAGEPSMGSAGEAGATEVQHRIACTCDCQCPSPATCVDGYCTASYY
jgi:hypothetical protein